MTEISGKPAKKPRGRGRPFRKGQSGNPGGRPKDAESVRNLARSYASEAIETLVKIMRDRRASATGRIGAATAILDRGFGKPTQQIESALNVSYDISDKPLTTQEWAAKYCSDDPDTSGRDSGSLN
jgi:hypothetical protein